jgi:beta-lactamase superfamily II metal-dependent hydrolase
MAALAPATIYNTGENGTIEMIVDGQTLKVRTEK